MSEGTVVTALNGGNRLVTISAGGSTGTSNYSFATYNYTNLNFAATGDDIGDTPRGGFSLNQYAPGYILTNGDTEFDTLISTASDAIGTP